MDADWRDFLTAGCFYEILNVDRAARQVDLLVKFAPASACPYHRHAATTEGSNEKELRRRITVADFERDWREKWPT